METKQELKNVFVYRNGKLYYKTSGRYAGSLRADGYIRMRFNGKQYLAHKLIFLYFHGYIPDCVDHIDRDRSNNKIGNLRDVPFRANVLNRTKRSNNKSGVVGVVKGAYSYTAYINSNGKRNYLGRYKTLREASNAYDMAKKIEFEKMGLF